MKNRNNNQNNEMNNNQNGYYDGNGNFIQGGYYDQDGNFISGGYYDQDGNFIPDSYFAPNNDLTPAGYYDTNGFFITTGYYDQDGNYVEDNSYSSNNINNEQYNQGSNFAPFNDQRNNFQGNNSSLVDDNVRSEESSFKEEPKKKKSKLGYLVALLLVCIIAAGIYYFKFYNKDSKVVHIDQYKVELAAYGTNRNGKVDVNITEVPEVKLYQYVKEWEKTLNQNYKEYTIDNKVNYYGLQLPGDTEKVGKSRLVLEGDKLINMKWSPEGNQKDVYNIVAVYSDIENVRGPASHLYYFTILNGEPIVLVTEQNQGNDKKYLYFKRTANVYLQEGFEKIVKG